MLLFYLIAVFGWPGQLENYADYISGIFWKVLGIAVTIEIILDVMKEFQTETNTDNPRDLLAQAKGYRNAYYFLMVVIASLGVNLFLSDLLANEPGKEHLSFAIPFVTLHIIVVVFFLANITKSVTQIYYYSKQ